MKEINYLLVAFEKVKDIFPYARVLKDGRAILQLADIRYLKGVTGIEVIGGHELDILLAQDQSQQEEPVNVDNQESAVVEPSPEENNGEVQPEVSEDAPEDNEGEGDGDGDEPADVEDDEGEQPEEGQDDGAAEASEESGNELEEPESGGKENEE